MSDLLGIASTAVSAYQRALSTVSNNIANANTVGYSEQTSDLQANAPQKLATTYMGTGVTYNAVTRQSDVFAQNNVRSTTATWPLRHRWLITPTKSSISWATRVSV